VDMGVWEISVSLLDITVNLEPFLPIENKSKPRAPHHLLGPRLQISSDLAIPTNLVDLGCAAQICPFRTAGSLPLPGLAAHSSLSHPFAGVWLDWCLAEFTGWTLNPYADGVWR
jgi:hypothetical protein